MATNRYFDHLNDQSEQDLYVDIVQEVIQMYGNDVLYIVRDIEKFDDLLREEKLSNFKTTYTIEAYVSNHGQNTTMQKHMSKFGFRFDESNEIIISAKSWDSIGTGFHQPREGDYVYIGNPDDQYASFVNCMFVITQVWDGVPDSMLFGSTAAYRLVLQIANRSYSNKFDTNYTDVNDFLNTTTEKENLTTVKKAADDFTDVNIIKTGNPLHKWGIK